MRYKFILFFLWLVCQFYLYSKYGVQIVFDSQRYIDAARDLQNVNPFYANYSLLIFPFVRFGAEQYIVLFQVILSGISLFIFYELILDFTQNIMSAFVGSFLLLFPDIQQWNFFVHTESVFISAVIIMLYFMVKNKWIYVFMFLILLAFMRPNGMLWLFSAGLVWLMNAELKKHLVFLFAVFFLVAVTLSFDFILIKIASIFDFENAFVNGAIIQGYEGFLIDGKNISYCKNCESYFFKLASLIFQNPLFSLKVFLSRLVFFILQIRPYYTYIHNFVLFIFFTPQFYMFFNRCFKNRKSSIYNFLFWVFLFQTLTVLISGVDWDNRFMVILLPYVAFGAAHFISQYASQFNINHYSRL